MTTPLTLVDTIPATTDDVELSFTGDSPSLNAEYLSRNTRKRQARLLIGDEVLVVTNWLSRHHCRARRAQMNFETHPFTQTTAAEHLAGSPVTHQAHRAVVAATYRTGRVGR